MEFRSIAQPVRGVIKDVNFIKGKARDIDFANKSLNVKVAAEAVHSSSATVLPMSQSWVEVPYDHLVVAVGSRANTLCVVCACVYVCVCRSLSPFIGGAAPPCPHSGIPGVAEHAFFLKELQDAEAIRKACLRNVEMATFPGLSTSERQQLLHFVIVGGGPTGVELAGQVYDFLERDVVKLFPDLTVKPTVTLVEAQEVLSSFDKTLREWAAKRLRDHSVEIVKATVAGVSSDAVRLQDGRTLPCSLCVWSTGLAPRKFTSILSDNNVFQPGPGGRVKTTDHLQVRKHPMPPPPLPRGMVGVCCYAGCHQL